MGKVVKLGIWTVVLGLVLTVLIFLIHISSRASVSAPALFKFDYQVYTSEETTIYCEREGLEDFSIVERKSAEPFLATPRTDTQALLEKQVLQVTLKELGTYQAVADTDILYCKVVNGSVTVTRDPKIKKVITEIVILIMALVWAVMFVAIL